jgi:hypothetical protein
MRVVQIKLELQGGIGDAAPALQKRHHLIEHGINIHHRSSTWRLTPDHSPTRGVSPEGDIIAQTTRKEKGCCLTKRARVVLDGSNPIISRGRRGIKIDMPEGVGYGKRLSLGSGNQTIITCDVRAGQCIVQSPLLLQRFP